MRELFRNNKKLKVPSIYQKFVPVKPINLKADKSQRPDGKRGMSPSAN